MNQSTHFHGSDRLRLLKKLSTERMICLFEAFGFGSEGGGDSFLGLIDLCFSCWLGESVWVHDRSSSGLAYMADHAVDEVEGDCSVKGGLLGRHFWLLLLLFED